MMAINIQLLLCSCLLLSPVSVCQHLTFEPEFIPSTTNASITTPNTSVATTNASVTTQAPSGQVSSWQGYVGAIIAVLFFGSNFLPVKKFETGDGMFFQWVFCVAVWIGGWITNWVLNFPKFYPLAMLGGALWATGNICVVPVIKTIGLGLGMLIWGSFNLLSGWASGRFGMFGLEPEVPNNPILNYVAIALAMVSAVAWMFVKSQPNEPIELDDDDDEAPLISDDYPPPYDADTEDTPWENKYSTFKKRVLGISLSVMSGLLYGLSFAPVIYVKDNYEGASQNDVDYVFAHFCGILMTSTIYFLIYCVIMKNNPRVYPSVILPAIGSGGMWAAADIGWFIANKYLSEAVSFPIVTTGPGIIASLWGIFLFKEVKGHRNYIIMLVAYAFTIGGAVLAGLSKA